MGLPECYVVRIYRREVGEPPRLNGVVEDLSAGRTWPFGSAAELWAALSRAFPPSDRGTGEATPHDSGIDSVNSHKGEEAQ